MPTNPVLTVEPFVERVGPAQDVVGASSYHFGYRMEATEDVLSVIEMPAEIVEEAVTSKLSLSVTMSPRGELVAAAGAFSPAYGGFCSEQHHRHSCGPSHGPGEPPSRRSWHRGIENASHPS
jgi:hypothetical protein